MSYVLQGLFVSFGLIVAIGAQNAFVLRQGLMRQHVFWVSFVCFLCDAVLLTAGVFGLGLITDSVPWFGVVLSLLGAIFLLAYGLLAFGRAYQGSSSLVAKDNPHTALTQTIAATLAITLLNPHVYLDTVVIVGGVAAPLALSQKYMFLVGAWLASFVWFFGLGFGAIKLIPLFKKPQTWRILDIMIGCVMWFIAVSLLMSAFK